VRYSVKVVCFVIIFLFCFSFLGQDNFILLEDGFGDLALQKPFEKDFHNNSTTHNNSTEINYSSNNYNICSDLDSNFGSKGINNSIIGGIIGGIVVLASYFITKKILEKRKKQGCVCSVGVNPFTYYDESSGYMKLKSNISDYNISCLYDRLKIENIAEDIFECKCNKRCKFCVIGKRLSDKGFGCLLHEEKVSLFRILHNEYLRRKKNLQEAAQEWSLEQEETEIVDLKKSKKEIIKKSYISKVLPYILTVLNKIGLPDQIVNDNAFSHESCFVEDFQEKIEPQVLPKNNEYKVELKNNIIINNFVFSAGN